MYAKIVKSRFVIRVGMSIALHDGDKIEADGLQTIRYITQHL